jgi:hypothetical protein
MDTDAFFAFLSEHDGSAELIERLKRIACILNQPPRVELWLKPAMPEIAGRVKDAINWSSQPVAGIMVYPLSRLSNVVITKRFESLFFDSFWQRLSDRDIENTDWALMVNGLHHSNVNPTTNLLASLWDHQTSVGHPGRTTPTGPLVASHLWQIVLLSCIAVITDQEPILKDLLLLLDIWLDGWLILGLTANHQIAVLVADNER